MQSPSSEKARSIIVAGNNSKVDCSVHYTTGGRSFCGYTDGEGVYQIESHVTQPAVIQNQTYTTTNLRVSRGADGVPHVVCSKDEVIINGTRFSATVLGGSTQHFQKPKRQFSIQANGIKIWDESSVPPYVRFKADLRVTLEFESNGKRVTLRRKKDTDRFGPSNIMPK